MHEANPSPATAVKKSGEMDCQELSWTNASGRLWECRPRSRDCAQWLSQGDNETRGLRREAAGEMGFKLLDGGKVELWVRTENLVPKWSTRRRRGE